MAVSVIAMVRALGWAWRAQQEAVRRQRAHEALMYEQVAQFREGSGQSASHRQNLTQALEQFRVEVPDAMKTPR